MFLKKSHALDERELRLVFGEDDLGRGLATFLQGFDELVKMVHVHRDDIKTEQAVAGNDGNSQDFGLQQQLFAQRGGSLTRRIDLNDSANTEAQ